MNPKENRHKTPRITWFNNSLYPLVTMNKFHYNKFGIIQIGVESLSQNQIPNTTKQLSHKYKSKRTTNQIQNLQQTKRAEITKPQNQNQALTNLSHYSKLQITNIKEPNKRERLFLTHTLNLPKQHYAYIGDLSWLAYPKPRRTRLLFQAQRRITPIPNKTQNQVVDKTSNRV